MRKPQLPLLESRATQIRRRNIVLVAQNAFTITIGRIHDPSVWHVASHEPHPKRRIQRRVLNLIALWSEPSHGLSTADITQTSLIALLPRASQIVDENIVEPEQRVVER